ncbi:hypothetical protein ASF60_14975 [Methylobacterium sp. Leaf113]|uniref:prepilin peptidase n=1 Tax=Methylobacterium sp. Leaf113 TaxID=1736259 RepID=UPI0006F4C6A7|nr:A24 family peptidase [Methylobacterium sp. Leaf113]KQP93245.1 hypothetical protein ASF60_14975 [Methylobacterium sp. Leaf113]
MTAWLRPDEELRAWLIACALAMTLLASGFVLPLIRSVRLWLRRSLVRAIWAWLSRVAVRRIGPRIDGPPPGRRHNRGAVRAPGLYADAALIALGATLFTAALSANRQGLGINCTLGLILVLAALIDLRWFRLPDRLTVPLGAIGLMAALLRGDADVAVTAMVLAGGIFLGLRWGCRALCGRDGLGLGDVKLVVALAAWLSPERLLDVIVLAALGGSAFGILQPLIQGQGRSGGEAWRRRLPFGPFLAAAFWSVWIAPAP